MKKRKKLCLLLAVLCLLTAVCGCGKSEPATEKKVYKAITNATYPPMDTVDENGNIVGFDMDLLNAIAEDQGFAVEYIDMSFDALVPALEAGNGDIIAASMVNTPEREARIDFVVYHSGTNCLMTRIDNDTIHSLDDLTADMKAATQIGSNFAGMLQEKVEQGTLGEAVLLDGFNECVLQLQNGDVDAVFTSETVAKSFISSVGAGKLKIAGQVQGATVGFGIRKGDTELYKMIETGLQNVKDSGKYDEFVMKWLAD